MKIYTRRGDAGDTDLLGAGRVGKDALRVDAYGAVDEANATLGLAAAFSKNGDVRAVVQRVQRGLFELGSYLASPDERRREKAGIRAPAKSEIRYLEEQIDAYEAELPPLKRFVLPGGTPGAAAFHVARTVCRRAERRLVALHREEALADEALGFLNRLSDLLFVLARTENHRAGVGDVEWGGPGS